MSQTATYAPARAARANDDVLHLLPKEGASISVELVGGRDLQLCGDEDRGRVFPRVKYRARRWLLEVADELRAHETDRANRRADNLSECTRYSRVQVCKCGHPHSGKLGTLDSRGHELRCHARSCPRCGPLRAHDMRRRIREWFDSDQAPAGAWWHITFTSQFDPYDPDDCTAEKLHERLEGLRKDWRKYWRKNKGAAACVGAEAGVWGEVHLHVMYCDTGTRPKLPNERIVTNPVTGEKRYRGDGALGFIDMPLHQVDDPARNVGEIVKYAAKTPGPRGKEDAPSWWSEPVVVPNPKLLARWEIATWGSRLVERYGAARQLPEVEPDPEPEPDPDEKCANCGAYIADFCEEKTYSTIKWVGWARFLKIDPFHRRE